MVEVTFFCVVNNMVKVLTPLFENVDNHIFFF